MKLFLVDVQKRDDSGYRGQIGTLKIVAQSITLAVAEAEHLGWTVTKVMDDGSVILQGERR